MVNRLMLTIKQNLLAHSKYILLVAVVLSVAAMSFAQTPVAITVDTNAIFTEVNTWIATFLPIVAIGIGISVALAILTFIGKQIVSAFRGG